MLSIMPKTLRASKSIIEPRFSSQVMKMTAPQLRDRINYLTRYLQGVTQKVSIYASLVAERKACGDRLSVLINEAKHGNA